MSKLLKVHTMFIYDDGSVVIKESDSLGKIDFGGCSSSMRQIAKVMEHVANDTSSSGIGKKISQGINAVAASENITQSSVHTKFTRKLGVSMSEFKALVAAYLDGASDNLLHVLRGACVARTKQADELCVNQILELLNNIGGSETHGLDL